MAEILVDGKVKVTAGKLIPVKNTHRPKFTNAKTSYIALWVENENGGHERCILFTKTELDRIEDRSRKNPEDRIFLEGNSAGLVLSEAKVKMGRIIPVKNTRQKALENYYYYAIVVEDYDGSNRRCLLLTNSELHSADHRARRNQEDLTSKTFWTDLFD